MKSIIKILKALAGILAAGCLLIVLLFGHADIPIDTLKYKYAQYPSEFITVDGMEVHIRDEGSKNDSAPIVLIHGTGASLHTFDEWAAKLKDQRRVIRMDLPAYGLTGPFPDANYSKGHYVDFMNNFLTTLKVKQCILAGNSLGGEIAWRYALKYPSMVDKLILIDAAGYPTNSKNKPIAFELAKIPVVKNIFTYITPRFLVKSSVLNVYHNKSKVSEDLVDRYFELALRAGNRQAFVDQFASKKDTLAIKNIGEIRQPTLLLWGDQDLLIPVGNAHKFHKDLPNDTLVILKNAGHVPMEELPTESLKVVTTFLENEQEVNPFE
ncbi:MAG: alpha/beta hydrolase [Cyclobacteriaceae bacterium]